MTKIKCDKKQMDECRKLMDRKRMEESTAADPNANLVWINDPLFGITTFELTNETEDNVMARMRFILNGKVRTFKKVQRFPKSWVYRTAAEAKKKMTSRLNSEIAKLNGNLRRVIAYRPAKVAA